MSSYLAFNTIEIEGETTISSSAYIVGSGVYADRPKTFENVTDDGVVRNGISGLQPYCTFNALNDRTSYATVRGEEKLVTLKLNSTTVASFHAQISVVYNQKDRISRLTLTGYDETLTEY